MATSVIKRTANFDEVTPKYVYQISGYVPTTTEIANALSTLSVKCPCIIGFTDNGSTIRSSMFYSGPNANYGQGVLISCENERRWDVYNYNGSIKITPTGTGYAGSCANLNDIIENNVTYWTSDTALNRPANWCIVNTKSVNSGTVAQIAYDIAAGRIYYRRNSNNVWHDWMPIISYIPAKMNGRWFLGHYCSVWGVMIVPIQNVYAADVTSAYIYINGDWVQTTSTSVVIDDPAPRIELSVTNLGVIDGNTYVCSLYGTLNNYTE